MGLRRWMRRSVRGIRDPTRGNKGYSQERQREWTTDTIDASGFQWWVVVVAGIGFLTDSYDIFALNVVNPMLGYVYWPETGKMPIGYSTGMTCSTLAGTMVGQVLFGIGADMFGRRKMYGLELIIVILGTLLFAMSSRGAMNSMNIEGYLVTWRFIMGLGIGADYPLSAVITSEFAPRKHRARMMTTLFFMQPLGQLLATLISLAAVASWRKQIPSDAETCYLGDGEFNINCVRAVDRLWRLVVGLGCVPALIALAFRLTIPESPRYKLDILQAKTEAGNDTNDFYGREFDLEETLHLTHTPHKTVDHRSSITRSASPMVSPGLGVHGYAPNHLAHGEDLAPDADVLEIENDDEFVEEPIHNDHARSVADGTLAPESRLPNPLDDPPLASKDDMYKFFITEGNWLWLMGTCLSWLFLDFAFYGLGLSSPTILRHIWAPDQTGRDSVYKTLFDNATHYLVLVSIGATVGGAAIIKLIKHVSPKVIQFWGFIILAILFIVTGSVWETLLRQSTPTGLYVLYILCQLVFNLGPNTTTFIIPAEIFPTRYRATCHGLAAAFGKLGSWVAQLFLTFAPWRDDDSGDKEWLGHILQVMTAFMIAGAVTTWFCVPETRDHTGKSRTLEVLGLGRKGLRDIKVEEKRLKRELRNSERSAR